MTNEVFGTIEKDGERRFATLYTLSLGRAGESSDRMTVRLTDFGATLVGIVVPDRNGELADVVLGYDSVEPYGERSTPYFGAVVGRYANRINKGRFELDGQSYKLPQNNGENSLHGGLDGLSRVFWQGAAFESEAGVGVELTYLSPSGEEGYPGNLEIKLRYLLTERRELRIEFEATSDEATVVNLSFHPYFNLAGQGNGNILDHELKLYASRFTPVDENLIPTGEIVSVEGTPMDFREFERIGERIDQDDEQLRRGNGYDHNWVVDNWSDDLPAAQEPQLVGVARDPGSGRQLEVLSTQPGIQFYTGNFLDGTLEGKHGARYPRRSGFCLETQHFPDSPNQPDFPSTVLRPGDSYRQVTVYRFGAVL